MLMRIKEELKIQKEESNASTRFNNKSIKTTIRTLVLL